MWCLKSQTTTINKNVKVQGTRHHPLNN